MYTGWAHTHVHRLTAELAACHEQLDLARSREAAPGVGAPGDGVGATATPADAAALAAESAEVDRLDRTVVGESAKPPSRLPASQSFGLFVGKKS